VRQSAREWLLDPMVASKTVVTACNYNCLRYRLNLAQIKVTRTPRVSVNGLLNK
jgi:hypothetical protein